MGLSGLVWDSELPGTGTITARGRGMATNACVSLLTLGALSILTVNNNYCPKTGGSVCPDFPGIHEFLCTRLSAHVWFYLLSLTVVVWPLVMVCLFR